MKSNYKELIVWQKAFSLSTQIYGVTKSFPKKETFGLTSQICRSAISIPSNIAEGQGRDSKNDFIRFLRIAKGSCNELETQILISEKLGYIAHEQSQKLQNDCEEVLKMTSGLIKKLSSQN